MQLAASTSTDLLGQNHKTASVQTVLHKAVAQEQEQEQEQVQEQEQEQEQAHLQATPP